MFRVRLKLRRSHADRTHDNPTPYRRSRDPKAVAHPHRRPTAARTTTRATCTREPSLMHQTHMRCRRYNARSSACERKTRIVDCDSTSLGSAQQSKRARARVRRGVGGGGTPASAASRACIRASVTEGAGAPAGELAAAASAALYRSWMLRRRFPLPCAALCSHRCL